MNQVTTLVYIWVSNQRGLTGMETKRSFPAVFFLFYLTPWTDEKLRYSTKNNPFAFNHLASLGDEDTNFLYSPCVPINFSQVQRLFPSVVFTRVFMLTIINLGGRWNWYSIVGLRLITASQECTCQTQLIFIDARCCHQWGWQKAKEKIQEAGLLSESDLQKQQRLHRHDSSAFDYLHHLENDSFLPKSNAVKKFCVDVLLTLNLLSGCT